MNEFSKTPRLFIEAGCSLGETLSLSKEQGHYIQNVLRLSTKDPIRVFDGCHGEFLAHITKPGKEVFIEIKSLLRPHILSNGPWLFFSPLKKNAMDFLIEKSVEIGVSRLCPVVMDRTIVRTIHREKIRAHIIEAAEQCERLDIPEIMPIISFESLLKNIPKDRVFYFCQERASAPHIASLSHSKSCAALIGPEGGFTPKETDLLLKNPQAHPISLGKNILRAETAALYTLSHLTEH